MCLRDIGKNMNGQRTQKKVYISVACIYIYMNQWEKGVEADRKAKKNNVYVNGNNIWRFKLNEYKSWMEKAPLARSNSR